MDALYSVPLAPDRGQIWCTRDVITHYNAPVVHPMVCFQTLDYSVNAANATVPDRCQWDIKKLEKQIGHSITGTEKYACWESWCALYAPVP